MGYRSAHDEWNELARLAARLREALVDVHRRLEIAERSVKFTRAAFDEGRLFNYGWDMEFTHDVATLVSTAKTFRYACSVSPYIFGQGPCVRVFAPTAQGLLEHVLCVREVDVRDAHGEYTPEFGMMLVTLSYVLGCERELTLEVDPE